jgi:hypothetical protein
MLNIEYYKDKLVELCVIDIDRLALIQGQPRICDSSLLCDECLLNNKNEFCSNEALNWLFSEYKEPEVDWSKVKVDTPILVKNEKENIEYRRHFARFENGKVYAWGDGATSFTANDEYHVTSWNYAKLAESEVLK